MSEFAAPSARDRDLVHDAAWRAYDMVLGHLAQASDARAIQLQVHVRIKAPKGADFHRSRAANADVHRHGTEQQQTEAVRKTYRLLLEQSENAAADVRSPRNQRVGVAQLADLRVVPHAVTRGEVIQRDARFNWQAAFANLHRADAQGAVGAGLQCHQHAAAQDRFAHIGAGIIGDSSHDIQPRGHARHPHLAAVEKAGKARRVTVRLAQQVLKFLDFKRLAVFHIGC